MEIDRWTVTMSRAELDRFFNLEAAKVWHEDGYYLDHSRLPAHPARIEEESRIFWQQVDPQKCSECGRPGEFYEGICVECNLSPYGYAWELEQMERYGYV